MLSFRQQYYTKHGLEGTDDAFDGFSDVDRQTELSDDDGSLTGLIGSNGAAKFNDTISVNEDPFFEDQCRRLSVCRMSASMRATPAPGRTRRNPPTARTSPYDYVTTVLFPGNQNPSGPETNWGTSCTNGTCTGIPIYRQYLTGVKGVDRASSTREWAQWMGNNCDEQYKTLLHKDRKMPPFDPYDGKLHPINSDPFLKFQRQCPSPFVRMAGTGLGQRSVLTVNNGRYYIDMTQSENYQRQSKELTPRIAGTSRFINLFERDKSYYVFFVFAKPTTHQMYQFYVGSGFDPGSIKGVRVNISGAPNSGSFTRRGASLDGDDGRQVAADRQLYQRELHEQSQGLPG